MYILLVPGKILTKRLLITISVYMDTINEVYDKCLLESHHAKKYQL